MIAEFLNVTKIYDNIVVGVSDVNFDIPKGITGFLGPNGSGKSTCIKLMAGELKPTKGSVTVLGRNPWNDPSLKNNVSYVSELTNQMEFLTPYKLLIYYGRMGGLSKQNAKIEAYRSLDMMGIAEFIDRKLNALSKGMKQRTKIAAAALMFPRDFILADEPLSGLDPFGRNLVLNMFKDLAKEGASVLISSHILFEVEKATNNLILIYNGQIVATGKTKAIREKLSDFPYKFIVSSNNPSEIGSMLINESEIVKSIEFIEDISRFKTDKQIMVTTTKPHQFQDLIMKIANESNIKIFELKNIEQEVQTETIFEYLIQ